MESARKALAEYFGGTYANPLGEVEKYINSSIGFASKRRSNDIQVRSIPEGMKIVMRSQILFDVGKAELNEEAKKLLTRLAVVIKSTNVAGLIRVEGHTDDSPISTPVFPSNWELSSARATSVVRIFESIGFPSSKLTAVGYGSSRPEASNRDESGFPLAENQALNRRVVINIVNSLDSRDQDKVPSETPVKKF